MELAQCQGGPGLALGTSVGSGGPREPVGEEAQTERWQGSGFPTVLCAAVAWHRISNPVATPAEAVISSLDSRIQEKEPPLPDLWPPLHVPNHLHFCLLSPDRTMPFLSKTSLIPFGDCA